MEATRGKGYAPAWGSLVMMMMMMMTMVIVFLRTVIIRATECCLTISLYCFLQCYSLLLVYFGHDDDKLKY